MSDNFVTSNINLIKKIKQDIDSLGTSVNKAKFHRRILSLSIGSDLLDIIRIVPVWQGWHSSIVSVSNNKFYIGMNLEKCFHFNVFLDKELFDAVFEDDETLIRRVCNTLNIKNDINVLYKKLQGIVDKEKDAYLSSIYMGIYPRRYVSRMIGKGIITAKYLPIFKYDSKERTLTNMVEELRPNKTTKGVRSDIDLATVLEVPYHLTSLVAGLADVVTQYVFYYVKGGNTRITSKVRLYYGYWETLD